MVTNDPAPRERIISLVESLPDEELAGVPSFLEAQLETSIDRSVDAPRYRPTPMGGFWQGVEIAGADIATARREMWGRFADGGGYGERANADCGAVTEP